MIIKYYYINFIKGSVYIALLVHIIIKLSVKFIIKLRIKILKNKPRKKLI